MDATLVTAIIGASATIVTAVIGAIATKAKDRENADLRKEWADYKRAVAPHESYLDLDYGISIISPKNEELVREWTKVTGVYTVKPPPDTLRLFTVDPERTKLGEAYWPQTIVLDSDFDSATKTWEAQVHIGDPQSNKGWGIIAAVVGSSTIVLWNYYYKVGPTIQWWAFEGWPPDAKMCDRIRVSRTP